MSLPGRHDLLTGLIAGVLLTSAAVCAGVWWLFSDGLTAQSKSKPLERELASLALRLSIPKAYREMRLPQKGTAEDLREGMEHFANHCSVCHGNDGSADALFGKGLNPRPPDLRLASTQSKSDGELYYIIEHGVRLGGMPAFGSSVTGGHAHTMRMSGMSMSRSRNVGQDSWNLVTFIRHLPTLTPDEQLEMERMNPLSPSELMERDSEDAFLNEKDRK